MLLTVTETRPKRDFVRLRKVKEIVQHNQNKRMEPTHQDEAVVNQKRLLLKKIISSKYRHSLGKWSRSRLMMQ